MAAGGRDDYRLRGPQPRVHLLHLLGDDSMRTFRQIAATEGSSRISCEKCSRPMSRNVTAAAMMKRKLSCADANRSSPTSASSAARWYVSTTISLMSRGSMSCSLTSAMSPSARRLQMAAAGERVLTTARDQELAALGGVECRVLLLVAGGQRLEKAVLGFEHAGRPCYAGLCQK